MSTGAIGFYIMFALVWIESSAGFGFLTLAIVQDEAMWLGPAAFCLLATAAAIFFAFLATGE